MATMTLHEVATRLAQLERALDAQAAGRSGIPDRSPATARWPRNDAHALREVLTMLIESGWLEPGRRMSDPAREAARQMLARLLLDERDYVLWQAEDVARARVAATGMTSAGGARVHLNTGDTPTGQEAHDDPVA